MPVLNIAVIIICAIVGFMSWAFYYKFDSTKGRTITVSLMVAAFAVSIAMVVEPHWFS